MPPGYFPNPAWKQHITESDKEPRFQTQKEAEDACADDPKCQAGDTACKATMLPKHINCEPRTTLACKLPRTCRDDPMALCPWRYQC